MDSTVNHKDGDTQGVAMGGTFIDVEGLLKPGVERISRRKWPTACMKGYKEVKENTYREKAIVLVGKFPRVAVGKASSNIPWYFKVIDFFTEHNI